MLADEQVVGRDELARKSPAGRAGQRHSVMQRQLRWHQQTLKHLGLLERAPQRHGVWRLTGEGKRQFVRLAPHKVLLGFPTELGIALWASAEDAFSVIDVPLCLALASPPYPIAKGRAYGRAPLRDYGDFICVGGDVNPLFFGGDDAFFGGVVCAAGIAAGVWERGLGAARRAAGSFVRTARRDRAAASLVQA